MTGLFLQRLPKFQSAAGWRRIARTPSQFAPRAEDVQSPRPFVPPSLPLGSAIEQAIAADPDSDSLREQWANETPMLAPFIRAQLAIARSIREGREPDSRDLRCEAEWLARLIPEWTERLKPWGARDLVFRRGSIERLSLSGRAFISLGSALFDRLPIRGVRLVAVKWYIDELRKCLHLTRLSRLDLSGNRIGYKPISQLLAIDWPRLTRLDLAGNDLSESEMEGLRKTRLILTYR